jgi:hypothetical protein
MTPGVAEHSSIILMVKPIFINIQHYSTLFNIIHYSYLFHIHGTFNQSITMNAWHFTIPQYQWPPASHLQGQSDLRGGDVAEVKHHRGGHHLAGDSNGYSTPQTNPKRLEIPTEILVINYISILFGTKHETNRHLV